MTSHYRAIGKQFIESIERTFGKQWRSCFNDEVARQLITAQAFFLMQGFEPEGRLANDLQEHGRQALNAALTIAGLSEDQP